MRWRRPLITPLGGAPFSVRFRKALIAQHLDKALFDEIADVGGVKQPGFGG
jgi:hypothetical protein